MRTRCFLAAALALGLLGGPGCATDRYTEVTQAREDYERCVEGWGAEHERCVSLRERQRQAEERYRGNSNPADDAWGRCAVGDPECGGKF